MINKLTRSLGAVLVAALLITAVLSLLSGCTSESGATEAEVDFQLAAEKLWDDFAFWAREAVLAAINETGNLEAAVNRWTKSADDLGAVVAEYYGEENGTAFTAALKKLQEDAVALLTAAKTGDTAALATANDDLTADAQAIAEFLDNANPEYWPYDTVLTVLQNILKYTTEYATAALAGEWETSVTAFDKMRDEVLVLSDTFATGVIGQYPEKFEE